MFSRRPLPYASPPRSRTGGLFGSNQTPTIRPPRGWKIALVLTSLSLLLLVQVVITIPMLDPSVRGMTLFTYKPKGGDGREYAVGSCNAGEGGSGVEALPCIETLPKQSIQGGFSNVPVILKLSSIWIGVFLGCLFLAVDAWTHLRRSHLQQPQTSGYGQTTMGTAGESRKGVLVVHIFVGVVFFFLWLMTTIWTASTPGVGAQPLGIASVLRLYMKSVVRRKS